MRTRSVVEAEDEKAGLWSAALTVGRTSRWNNMTQVQTSAPRESEPRVGSVPVEWVPELIWVHCARKIKLYRKTFKQNGNDRDESRAILMKHTMVCLKISVKTYHPHRTYLHRKRRQGNKRRTRVVA